MEKGRRKASFFVCVFLILVGIVGLVWFASPPAWGAEGRIEYLKAGSGTNFSTPEASGEVVVWSEKANGNVQRACFFVVGSSYGPQIMDGEDVLPNVEKVRVDGDIAVYRDSSKNLHFKNWKTGEKGLLAAGDVSSFYRISGDKVVYFKGSSLKKDCFLQTVGKKDGELLFNDGVKDLAFFNRNGYSFVVWIDSSENLKFMDLKDRQIRVLPDIRPVFGMISLWGDTLVYAESGSGRLFRVKLCGEAGPKYLGINVNTGNGFVYLYEDFVYYRRGDDICRFNMEQGSEEEVLVRGARPVGFAAGDQDFFWLGEDYKLYWYAGLDRLDLQPAEVRIKKGEAAEFSLQAVYRNGWKEEVLSRAVWEMAGEGSVYVEEGRVKGLEAGEVLLTAFYEGKQAASRVRVVELTGIRTVPEGEAVLKEGERLVLQGKGVFSDGVYEVLTEGVVWTSTLGNPVGNGVYYAEKTGDDVVSAVYGDFGAVLIIRVVAEEAPGGAEENEGEGEGGSGGYESGQGETGETGSGQNEGEAGYGGGEEGSGEIGGGEGEGEIDAGGEEQGEADNGQQPGNSEDKREEELKEGKNSGGSGGSSSNESYAAEVWEQEKTVPVMGKVSETGWLVELGQKEDLVLDDWALRELKARELVIKKDGILVSLQGIRIEEGAKAYLAVFIKETGEKDSFSDFYALEQVSGLWELEVKKEGLADNLQCRIMLEADGRLAGSDKIAGFYRANGRENFAYAGRVEDKEGFWELVYRGDGVYGVFEVKTGFADLEGHWAKEAAEFLGVHHVIGGTGKGSFAPDREISRAEAAAMLVRMAEGNGGVLYEDEKREELRDVKPDAWYFDAVVKAKKAGWLWGRKEGIMAPEDAITREEMAVVLYRFLGKEVISGIKGEEVHFIDEDALSYWARPAVEALSRIGIVKGMGDGSFAPGDKLTRAQVASLLYRVWVETQGRFSVSK